MIKAKIILMTTIILMSINPKKCSLKKALFNKKRFTIFKDSMASLIM